MAEQKQLTDEQLDEMIRRALMDVAYAEAQMLEEMYPDVEVQPPSLRAKRKMNRIFRVHAGCKTIPYPEADTPWRRIRDWSEFALRRLRKRIAGKLRT